MNVSRRNTNRNDDDDDSHVDNQSTDEESRIHEEKKHTLFFSSKPSFSQWRRKFIDGLFQQVPIHSIVFLRVFWGLVMAYEMATYMTRDYRKTKRYLVEPEFMFKYWAFEW